jgi:hypothetical protein
MSFLYFTNSKDPDIDKINIEINYFHQDTGLLICATPLLTYDPIP